MCNIPSAYFTAYSATPQAKLTGKLNVCRAVVEFRLVVEFILVTEGKKLERKRKNNNKNNEIRRIR